MASSCYTIYFLDDSGTSAFYLYAMAGSGDYVLARPEDFDSTGFLLPNELMHTSFRPWRLFKSCLRRLWLARRK